MKNVLFIAWHDVRHQLRQGSTLLWVFVLPAVFFYFIGTVTSGFSGTMSGAKATPIVIAAKNPGFLRDQVDLRLRDNSFEPDWREEVLGYLQSIRPDVVFEMAVITRARGSRRAARSPFPGGTR